MRSIRLNPRQRWAGDEPKNTGLDLPRSSSVVAGVPAVMWGAFIALSKQHSDAEAAKDVDNRAPLPGEPRRSRDLYFKSMDNMRDALWVGMKYLDEARPGQWVESSYVRLAKGRGSGPDQEITVVSYDYAQMRSFLTQASLGITDKYPRDRAWEMTPWDDLLYKVLRMLDKSSDRRPYNRYTYRDIAISDLDALGRSRRLDKARSDARFRKEFDKIMEGAMKTRQRVASEPLTTAVDRAD